MSDRRTSREQLTLIGLASRTNNAAELTEAAKIAPAWKAFVDGHVQARILNQVHSTATYVAYYDYEKDDKGDYSFLLGAAVRDGTLVPEGMIKVVIPASKYAVFEVATPAEVPAAWRQIADAKLHRSYTGDLEVHRKNQGIEIYVAIK